MITLTKADRLIEISHRIEREPWRIEYDLSSSLPPHTEALITRGLTTEAFGRLLNTASNRGYTVYVS